MFQSGDDSSGRRISLRFAMMLLIPAVLVLCLLYAAQSQEEATHGRNLRWLAQMGTQIADRVQIHSDFVRDKATQTAKRKPAGAATAGYSIDNLQPAECGDPKIWRNLSVQEDGAERWLFFRSSGNHTECARSDLKALVEPAIRKDAFTSVILAQRDGLVLYQSGPDSLRITNASSLFARSSSGTGGTAGTEAGPRGEVPTSSIHLTSQIGDENFQVFMQPLGPDWILIGMSEKLNLLRSSAPNGLMLIVPLVLLLVGLCWPLQRLWTMSPLAALHRRHVVMIGVCSLGVVVVLSLLMVYAYSQQLSMARADEQLRKFALALGRNFSEELKLAVTQLQSLDDLASHGKTESEVSILADRLTADDVMLPFEYADWINRKGEKTQRWTTKSTAPQQVNVADRTYFQDAVSGATLQLPGFPEGGFTLQQVLSRTSGESVTMLGMASKRKGGAEDIQVASLAVNLVSLFEPVAPQDLGFAVIDAAGGVLFHSERSRILVENLFEESQESGELKSVVLRRIPAFVNLEYDASPHRMYVTPIPGVERLPWTLAVFRKLSGNRIVRMQILLDTSALLCLYGIGMALAAGFGLLVAGRGRAARYAYLVKWCTGLDRGRMYVAGAGFVLAIVVWRAFERFHGSDLLSVALESSVVFLAMTALGLDYPARGLRAAAVPVLVGALGWWFGDWFMAVAAPVTIVLWGLAVSRDRYAGMLRTAWLVWGVELALVVGIAPTLLLTRLAFEYEGGLRVRDSQFWLSTAELKRRQALGRAIAETPGVAGNPDMQQALAGAVRLNDPDPAREPLYYYGSETSRISLVRDPVAQQDVCGLKVPSDIGPRVGAAAAVSGLVLSAIELPNEGRMLGTDARRRALEPAHNLWSWQEHKGTLCLYTDSGVVRGSAPLPVFDPLEVLPIVVQAASGKRESASGPGPLVSAGPVWLALVAILAAFGWWMNTLRRRLLLMDAAQLKAAGDPAYDEAAAPPARLLLLAAGGAARRALPQNLSGYAGIDLAAKEVPLENLSANGLVVDHFEARFQNPAVRKARLERLAALVLEGKPMAIRSSIDCVSFLSGDPASAADENELKAWYTLMNHFERRVLLPGNEPPDYAAIWDTCSEHEKDFLMHLCRHGLVNPRACQVAGLLLRRGLLQRTATLSLEFADPRFRRFVAEATILVPEKTAPRTGGNRLPAYAIGLLLLGFVLLFSQEELTTRIIGFLTTVTGGFETVRKQLAGMQGFGDAKKG